VIAAWRPCGPIDETLAGRWHAVQGPPSAPTSASPGGASQTALCRPEADRRWSADHYNGAGAALKSVTGRPLARNGPLHTPRGGDQHSTGSYPFASPSRGRNDHTSAPKRANFHVSMAGPCARFSRARPFAAHTTPSPRVS